MARFLLLSLFIPVVAASGCRSPRVELTNQQKQLAADSESVIDDYLAQNIERPGFGGKVFCSHKALDIEDKGERVNEYVFALCQEYRARDGGLSEGTGTAIPVVIQMERRGQSYQVVAQQVPGDSPRFASDVKRMFPEKTHNEIFYGNRSDLIAAAERRAKTYYGIQ